MVVTQLLELDLVPNFEVILVLGRHRAVVVVLIADAALLDLYNLLPQLLERLFGLPVLVDPQVADFELPLFILRPDGRFHSNLQLISRVLRFDCFVEPPAAPPGQFIGPEVNDANLLAHVVLSEAWAILREGDEDVAHAQIEV